MLPHQASSEPGALPAMLPTVDPRAIAEAVRTLGQPHREVLVECAFRGSDVQQAASRLRLPPEVVKARLSYALRALRLALQEQGVVR